MKSLAQILALLAACCIWPAAAAETLGGQEILERSHAVSKVIDSSSDISMILTSKSGQERSRKLLSLTKLRANASDNMRVLRFRFPADVKGTVILLVEQSGRDDDMWIYLPALKKTRRLISNNKRDAFVGSDFSFGDILGHKPENWTAKIIRDDVSAGRPVYVVEAMPKTDQVKANDGYSKRLLWIAKDTFVALRTDYWDDTGEFLKSIVASDVRLVDPARQKYQFMRAECENKQTGHKTVLLVENFRANVKLQDEVFTTRYMEKEE